MAIHKKPANPVSEKLRVLRHFGILTSNATVQKEQVRTILASCTSEAQMDVKLYNVLRGNETIKEFIARHNELLKKKNQALKTIAR
jgi:hypothetical protein